MFSKYRKRKIKSYSYRSSQLHAEVRTSVPVELELKQEHLLAMYRGKLAEQFVAQELPA